MSNHDKRTIVINSDVKEIQEADQKYVCGFCHRWEINSLMWGPMYHLKGITVHYFCMLFSAGLDQRGNDSEGILGFLPKDVQKEFERGKKLRCKFCRQPRATVGCSVKKCKTSFHYNCGLENGSGFEFIDSYQAYCKVHKAQQTPITLDKKLRECPICYDTIKNEENPLLPPCCKKLLFHHHCMMNTARNSGAHFFKCPLCNDKKKFPDAMRRFGIYIPDSDAQWEIVPDAYSDLGRQYSRCDMEPCQCPRGREYNSKDENEGEGDVKWRIVRCGACGGGGVHKKCANLPNLSYRCPTCAPSLQGTSFDCNSDDELPSQGIHNRASISQSSRIVRRRYDSSSSDDEEQVPNFAEVLDQSQKLIIPNAVGYSSQSSESDSEENCSLPSSLQDFSAKKRNIVREIYGKKQYKVIMDDDEINDSEEDDDNTEEEKDFILSPSTKTVSMIGQTMTNIYWRNRRNSLTNGIVDSDSKKVGSVARSNGSGRLKKYKSKLDKLRHLYAQIPNHDPVLETDGSPLSQVRTGLVEAYDSLSERHELEFLTSSVGRIKAGPSNRMLRSSAAYPTIKNTEQIPEWMEDSVAKIADIFKTKLHKFSSSSNDKKSQCKSIPQGVVSKNLSKKDKFLVAVPKTQANTPFSNTKPSSNANAFYKTSDAEKRTRAVPILKLDQSIQEITIEDDDRITQQQLSKKHNKTKSTEMKKDYCDIRMSAVRETTPTPTKIQKPPVKSNCGSSEKRENCNKTIDAAGFGDPDIIFIKSTSNCTKSPNMRQSKLDLWVSPTKKQGARDQPKEDNQVNEEVKCTQMSSVVLALREKKESSNRAGSINAAEISSTTDINQIKLTKSKEHNRSTSDSDSDCFIIDQDNDNSSKPLTRQSSRSLNTKNKNLLSESPVLLSQSNSKADKFIGMKDEIKLNAVNLVRQKDNLEKEQEENLEHPAVPGSTAFIEFIKRHPPIDENQIEPTSKKYFNLKTSAIASKALLANTSALSKSAGGQKLKKIQCRETKTGPGPDTEIIILDSSDEEDCGKTSFSRDSQSSDNCGERVSLPNRDENGNTSSKRERAAGSEDLEGSGSGIISKRPRVAETSRVKLKREVHNIS